MFYEHDRKWFATGQHFNAILNLLENRLGAPLIIEDVDVIFLEGDIRYLRIKRNEKVITLLNIKARILPEAFVESTYKANESVYLDALSKSELLPYLKKRRYTWEILREKKCLSVHLDLYGESDFLRVKLVERNAEIGFSRFVKEYKVNIDGVFDVSSDDLFRDRGLARLLFNNDYDYSEVGTILLRRLKNEEHDKRISSSSGCINCNLCNVTDKRCNVF